MNVGRPARPISAQVSSGSGAVAIISEYTYAEVKDRVIVRELDNIRVKGKNKPVLIYELVDVPGGLEPPKPTAAKGKALAAAAAEEREQVARAAKAQRKGSGVG